MGNACNNGDAEAKRDREIDQRLKLDKAQTENEVKLLLLGAGESGKTTIVRQMRIIHLDGYSLQERMAFLDVIYSNTIQSMKVLVRACKKLGIEIKDEQSQQYAEELQGMKTASAPLFSQKIGDWIKYLWNDEDIKAAFARASEFQLNDSAGYYFDNIDRLMEAEYTPSVDDVLRSRVKTTGIVETRFKYGGLVFNMFDVGGQRNERRKWIHCFQNVTAIIFVVGISEYDQTLYEDETQNRMKEAMLLFDEICNSRWFTDTSMILFLNKTDLFREKFCKRKVPMTIFPNYDDGGTHDYKQATDYIQKQFENLNRNQGKLIYPHLTCATDTSNIKVVFSAVKEIILQRILRESGFSV